MLEEYIKKNYSIIFFVHEDFSRLLEFRIASDEATWHLVSKGFFNYTCTRREFTKELRKEYEIEPEQGVAFFKSETLVDVLDGFAIKDFKEKLQNFDPLTSLKKKSDGDDCCECCVIL
ncbi:hypothetical protein IW140_005852 [Coemansia sp. RSA 1813]|nr:hypothetical protein IW140_005852 [Coemansia sp. RSA 1813]